MYYLKKRKNCSGNHIYLFNTFLNHVKCISLFNYTVAFSEHKQWRRIKCWLNNTHSKWLSSPRAFLGLFGLEGNKFRHKALMRRNRLILGQNRPAEYLCFFKPILNRIRKKINPTVFLPCYYWSFCIAYFTVYWSLSLNRETLNANSGFITLVPQFCKPKWLCKIYFRFDQYG